MWKWIVMVLSLTSILVWLAVVWVYLGQDQTIAANEHALAQREMVVKTDIISLTDKNTSQPIEKQKTNVNKISTSEKKLESLAANGPISIDTILSALGISY